VSGEEKVEIMDGQVFIELYVQDPEVVDWVSKLGESNDKRVDEVKRVLRIGVTAITSAWAGSGSLAVREALEKWKAEVQTALAQSKKEITDTLNQHFTQEVDGQVSKLYQKLDQIERQTCTVLDRLGGIPIEKGKAFEKGAVLDLVQRAALLTGDRVEHVGKDNRPGDIIVEVLYGQLSNRRPIGTIIIEAKDTKRSEKELAGDLENAIRHRNADAGILIFARQDQNPYQVSLRTLDDNLCRLVCVWDEQGLNFNFAYHLARIAIITKYLSAAAAVNWQSLRTQIAEVITQVNQIDEILKEAELGMRKVSKAINDCRRWKGELIGKLERLEGEIAGQAQG
jgi:hypothetical protein